MGEKVRIKVYDIKGDINLPIVTGILKGYDQLLNLVLDEVEEEASGKSHCIILSMMYA